MKIILTEKIQNQGEIGDIVNVKNGFARNFLIPNGKAIHYSDENYKTFEKQKEDIIAKNKEISIKAQSSKEIIESKDVIIIENASDDGRLYGAINSNIISDKINQINSDINISKSNIHLNKPIKNTGVYSVRVELCSDVEAKIRLIVARNESEVELMIKKYEKKINETADKSLQKSLISKKEEDGEENADNKNS